MDAIVIKRFNLFILCVTIFFYISQQRTKSSVNSVYPYSRFRAVTCRNSFIYHIDTLKFINNIIIIYCSVVIGHWSDRSNDCILNSYQWIISTVLVFCSILAFVNHSTNNPRLALLYFGNVWRPSVIRLSRLSRVFNIRCLRKFVLKVNSFLILS